MYSRTLGASIRRAVYNALKLDFVGFQETKKENFGNSILKYINKDFIWHALPAKGTAGGILVGVNERKFDVIA